MIKALETLTPRLWPLTGLSALLTIAAGITGGAIVGSRTNSAGWGSLGFIVGAFKTLAIAIPVVLLVLVISVLLFGVVLFLRIRLRTDQSLTRAPKTKA